VCTSSGLAHTLSNRGKAPDLTSLSGIRRVFDKEGIAFDRLDVRSPSGLAAHTDPAHGRGPSLATRSTAPSTGSQPPRAPGVVPSYQRTQHRRRAHPLVGQDLTGVGGKAVQVIAFRVDGPPATPEVRLDPTRHCPRGLRDSSGVLPGLDGNDPPVP